MGYAFYEILGKQTIWVMMVWLFHPSLLLIEQGYCCYSSSAFFIFPEVFVLPHLYWLYLLPGSVLYLKQSLSFAWLLDSHLNVVWFWQLLMFVLTRFSCSFNKFLFAFTAKSHASLQDSCVFIPSATAENISFHYCRLCYIF